MNRYCVESAWRSLTKYGEPLCGDSLEIINHGTADAGSPARDEAPDDGLMVMVLADGLGSGVKANILSTLTAKIISTMTARSMPLTECVAAIAATLPVCEVRKIAYSTFTVIRVSQDLETEIVQYDNPAVIFLRNGKLCDYPQETIVIDDREIRRTVMRLQEHDTFIAMSDGVIHAGVGGRLNFGWQWKHVAAYMENAYRKDYSAQRLSSILLEECLMLYDDRPGDDATVCAIKIRRRRSVHLMIGPPADRNDVGRMMQDFFSKEGVHIVCGGTTSTLAANFLGKKLRVSTSGYVDPEIPPIAELEGVDLVTEGVVTINRVLLHSQNYLAGLISREDWFFRDDAASRIARILFEEGTDIGFFVGKAINPAHQNPDLPIGFNIKMHLIKELAECLTKMGKRVEISYF